MTHWTDYLPPGACENAVAFCRGHASLASAWAACERGDWMVWLLDRLDAWPDGARAEFERATAPARTEYERARATAWAEYERAEASAWTEYGRVKVSALAEYGRATVVAIRSLVPTPPTLEKGVAS